MACFSNTIIFRSIISVLGSTFTNPRYKFRVLQTSYIRHNMHCKPGTQVLYARIHKRLGLRAIRNITRSVVTD